MYQQVYAGIRDAILGGRLPAGARLPASRLLAGELGVSRTTVSLAFDQLRAEGYLFGRERAGTFVATAIPDALLEAAPVRAPRTARAAVRTTAPRRNGAPSPRPAAPLPFDAVHATLGEWAIVPFRAGVPALDLFPAALWSRLLARRWRRPTASLLGYGSSQGLGSLREAIAVYVRAARAVRCSADQVIVTAGAQHALSLAGRVLVHAGETVWMEDPGYLAARDAWLAFGAHVVPVPVDDEGIRVDEGVRLAPRATLAYVSPSHQYPLGHTMSLARRLALLEWAGRAGAWILEDDYDSEFRYASRPLASLQGLDERGRVVYVGTFAKTLYPGLRLGYLVVPEPLVDAFVHAAEVSNRHPPGIEQAVLAEFLADGHFARHVRRMRAAYAERQEALLRAGERTALGGHLAMERVDAGMHLVGWLRRERDDVAAARRADAARVFVRPISRFVHGTPRAPGLMLGFAGWRPAAIRAAAARLARALDAGR